VFGSDGHSNDGGHRVFHVSDAVGIFVVRNGSGLNEILIDSNESYSVSARNVGDVFYGSAHHEDGSLDGFDVEIVFFTGFVISSHDSDFLAGGDSSREDSSEGEESRFISGGHHFGNVHHEGSFGVTGFHGHTAFVVFGSLIEILRSVFLGGNG